MEDLISAIGASEAALLMVSCCIMGRPWAPVQFPRRPCSQLGRELNLSMPRSALKMANLWAPGKVPEERIITRLALRQLLATKGWVSESYAPSCTSLTPSMRGVTRSHIKGGFNCVAQRVLELRGLKAATEEMRLAELWGEEVAPIYRRLELLTPLIGEAVELAVNLDRARCLEDSNRIADSKACSLVFENLGVRPHQELLQEAILVEYKSNLGKAMFVSHQWLTATHPDPKFQQLKVLQTALKNVFSGSCKIRCDVTLEFRWGRNGYSQGELKAAPIFVWYDYFSCPQPMADQMSKVKSIVFNPLEDLRRAISSIPAYVASCHFFVALCPMLQTDGIELNQYTWARRGWCRAEKMAWELSDRHGLVLMVDSPEHLTLLPVWESFQTSPGDGEFSAEILEAFLHQNGFLSIRDRDQAGWSPICYAAMNGDPQLVEALLSNGADPNDCIFHAKSEALIYAGTTVLAIAAGFGSNEVVRLLLCAKAKPNQRDSAVMGGGTSLHVTTLSDNAEGVRILLEARGDPSLRRAYPNDVLEIACAMGAINVIKELLPQKVTSQHLLHWALINRGGSPDVISTLLLARMDPNEQYYATRFRFKVAFSLFQAKNHILKASQCSSWGTICYHLHGATPLMLSMLSRSFPAAQVLLNAGARLDLKNCRGQSVFDFAVDQQAPLSLLSEFWSRGAGEHAKHSTIQRCQQRFEAPQFLEGNFALKAVSGAEQDSANVSDDLKRRKKWTLSLSAALLRQVDLQEAQKETSLGRMFPKVSSPRNLAIYAALPLCAPLHQQAAGYCEVHMQGRQATFRLPAMRLRFLGMPHQWCKWPEQ
eukprot:symbB.v1.2.022415.t1/scaffold1989.1/size93477/3